MQTARGLNWRDGLATLMVGFSLLLTAAVIFSWGWPVVGDSYRIGALVLFAVGLTGCIAAGESFAGRDDPFLTVGKWLSVLAPLMLLGTLVFNSQPFFLGLTAVIVALWLLATVHHLATSLRSTRAHPGTA